MKKTLDNTESSALFKSISMMLSAGVSPAEALGILYEDCAEGDTKDKLRALSEAASVSGSFGQAALDTGVLPSYAAGMIDIAERAGRLEEVLQSLSEYYDRQETISERLRGALLYPLIMLVLMCGVLILLTTFVLPVFVGVYEDMSGSLAGSSYAYVAFSKTLSLVCLILVLFVCAVFLICAAASKTERGKKFVYSLLENFPLTKGVMREKAVSELCDILSIFMRSGIDEETALRSAVPLITHSRLRAQCIEIQSDIEGGGSLAKSLFDRKILTPVYGRLLLAASRGGALSECMFSVSKSQGEHAEESIMRLIEFTEPLLTGFLTVCVGIVLLCVMLPLVGILGAI